MAIRVAQIGTGNVGGHALTELITNPQFELTGVWVSSESKAGKDAAELVGLEDSTGITATNDLEAVLAAEPECAVYRAMADNRLPEALEDYRPHPGRGRQRRRQWAGVPAVPVAGPPRRTHRTDRGRGPGGERRACSSTASTRASPMTSCHLR